MSRGLMIYRHRWRNRTLRIGKWLVVEGDEFRPGDVVCEVISDNGPEIITADTDEPGWLIGRYVMEGDDVPPSAQIGEWGTNGPKQRLAEAHLSRRNPARIHRRDVDVMISYRRADSDAFAGRLHEVLGREFGEDRVFMDVFSIQPGEDWLGAIQFAAATCRSMVVLIGREWESIASVGDRHSRLHTAWDPVRREISAALDRGAWVVPVLASRTDVPDRQELPHEVQQLFDHQASLLTTVGWKHEAPMLLNSIRQALAEEAHP